MPNAHRVEFDPVLRAEHFTRQASNKLVLPIARNAADP
jgi:hypothetical protein